MFGLDQDGYAFVDDDKIDKRIVAYLESEHSSLKSAETEIRAIQQVIETGVAYRGSGNALYVDVGPEQSLLFLIYGPREGVKYTIKTPELLNYLILWRDFLQSQNTE